MAICEHCHGTGFVPDSEPEPVLPEQQEPVQSADPFLALLTEAERAANVRHLHELAPHRIPTVKAALLAGAKA